MKNIDVQGKRDWVNIIDCSTGNISVKPFVVNKILGFRRAFGQHAKKILDEQKKVKRSNGETGSDYYDSFKNTTNGETIINPKFDVKEGQLIINAEVGLYESYHAYNGLKNGFGDQKIDFNNSINYKVLSAGVIMYHEKSNSFYLFKRPENSQEAPGEIDLLGGCMNTKDGVKDGKIHPELYVKSRIKTKAGLEINPDDLKFLGVQEFNKRGFYNLVYFYNLTDEEAKTLQEKGNLSQILNDTIDNDRKQDNPGGAALDLALKYLDKYKIKNRNIIGKQLDVLFPEDEGEKLDVGFFDFKKQLDIIFPKK